MSEPWGDSPVMTASWVAAHDGVHTVECVLAPGSKAACELVAVCGPCPPSWVDRAAVEAALRRGNRALREWSASATKRAQSEFRSALERSRALGLRDLEVDALVGLAEALDMAGTSGEAATLLQTAAERAKAADDVRRLVLAAARLNSSLAVLGRGAPEELSPERTLALAVEKAFPLGTALGRLAQGDVHYWRSELAAALTDYSSALEAFSVLGNVEGAIESQLGIGYTLADLSQDLQAKVRLERGRDLARSIGDRRREATALRSLGNVLGKMTEEADAIRSFQAAQVLFEQADDRAALIGLYNGLGDLHGRLNDLAVAIQYHQKAEALAHSAGLRALEAAALLHIAAYQRRLGRLPDAEASYASARSLYAATGDAALAAVALAGLGNVAAAEGHPEVGLGYLQEALRSVRSVGEKRLSSGMLGDIAEILLGLGRTGPSREAASEALSLAVEAGDWLQESRSWYLLARVARLEGALDEARRLGERSLEVGEGVRARVPGHELRALFFEQLEGRYRFQVDVLMDLERARPEAPFETLALAASERGRARALLERLGRGSPSSDAKDVARLEREQALRGEIRNQALREDLATHEASHGTAPPLAQMLAELRRAQGADSPGQVDPALLDASRVEMIRKKLAAGTLLVELCLGAERSYLWALDRDRLVVHTLPPREALESQARELYALLTGRQRDVAGPARKRRDLAEAQDALFHEKAAALSRAVLGPIDDLDAFAQLVVVSDGLLSYVPFAALPHPRAIGGDYRPLVLSHEVVRVPSLAAFAALADRAESKERALERGARLRIAVLADPVFTTDDPRVDTHDQRATGQDEGALSPGSTLRGVGRNLASLPRLLASREEALSIARSAPGADVTITTGFGVDRASTEATLANAYEVVHLATHGVLNDEHPLLSGIVTSLVDREGHRQDGFLRVQDVYESHVGAELVVLSACETALGRLLRGEGITGLVQALLHAGANTVVASDWRVEDAATQELMAEFYRSLLSDGATVSGALRAAQIKLLQRRRTRAPFFWAAFEVHGLSPRFAPRGLTPAIVEPPF